MSENESTVYEYDTAGGKLYIKVRPAERRTYTDYSSDRGGPGEQIQPRLEIGTDPEFKAEVERGFVKVRGRKYATQNLVKYLPNSLGAQRGGSPWSRESSYSGGFRNDRGGQVAYQAKAWDSLREIERDVLDRFHEEHPEWEVESARLYFAYEVSDHLYKAQRLRGEADENERKANEWQARLDELTV
ncbi:hypothetical protein ABZ348_31145 [Streptomyces sp. NPDC005963]|uniref:hypothetical protein n=1 Tax=Streptomyces sp. NPDC005963 TaxID=3156721 RepID=UPI0033F94559